ncbi:hypothetical protein DBP21_10425 [Streptomyces sp. CS147]|nr:hypothetical protein DBP21_10425 [Streptomyces sp. CS147]
MSPGVRSACDPHRAGWRTAGHRAGTLPPKPLWRPPTLPATFSRAVLKTEEVVPVNAMSTWVLPCGVTVGR